MVRALNWSAKEEALLKMSNKNKKNWRRKRKAPTTKKPVKKGVCDKGSPDYDPTACAAMMRGKQEDMRPRNAAGFTSSETLALVSDRGAKFTQEEASYREVSENPFQVCGSCRFFLRQEGSEVGRCEVVDGEISPFGNSIYFIDAASEGMAALDEVLVEAGEQPGEVLMSKEMPVKKRFMPIIKTDKEERFIYGIVYEPDVLDAHDEWASAETIRKAAHLFLAEFQEVNLMHMLPLEKRQVSIVESFIAPATFKIGDQSIKKGSWLMGAIVHDNDIWGDIASGELTGWSLEGYAQYAEEDQAPMTAMKRMFADIVDSALDDRLGPLMDILKVKKSAEQETKNAEA